MTPLDYYNQKCADGSIVEDQHQLQILQDFQYIYTNLKAEHKKRFGLLSVIHKRKAVPGLYLWGSVGVGKTFLMDCFYDCIPFPEKKRMHFHQFMQFVHLQLKRHQGEKNPLDFVAKKISQDTLLLCFDEFFVSDITDAMILARLLTALFKYGVCLVATSNVAPDDLYKNGLQRKLFLPAIAQIKQHTKVQHIAAHLDYRMRQLKQAGVFFLANEKSTSEQMENIFNLLAKSTEPCAQPIEIHGRAISIKKQAADVVWFDFNSLCSIPRSQQDYLEIAEKYKTVFISNIPHIPADAKNTISLFIRLVDVLYDARTRLIISAADQIEKIYSVGSMAFEYNRTCSRLIEMQSENYFLKNNNS